MAQRICVYPGSFDPITIGHLDIIRRACAIFDLVIIAVLRSETKTGLFTNEQRLKMINESVKEIPNVSVEAFDGLLVAFMAQKGAKVIVRGLRGPDEYLSELRRHQINKMLDPTIETIFLPASDELTYVSSSAAKQVAAFGGDTRTMLPPPAFEALEAAYPNKRKQ